MKLNWGLKGKLIFVAVWTVLVILFAFWAVKYKPELFGPPPGQPSHLERNE